MKYLYFGKEKITNPIGLRLSADHELEIDKEKHSVSGYKLLIMDETSCVGGNKQGQTLLKSAFESGTAVLVLDPDERHKSALAEFIGFRSDGPGIAYLVIPAKKSGSRPRYRIFELALPASLPVYRRQEAWGEGEGKKGETQLFDVHLFDEGPSLPEEAAAAFTKRVAEEIERKPEPEDIPDGLKSAQWVYSRDDSYTASGSKSSVGTPKSQYIGVYTTYEFEAYLNNYPETGAFQWLALKQSGIFQTNGMQADGDHHKGWYLTQIAPQHSCSQLFYYQSSPANTIGKKTVSTSTGFSVSFDKGGPSGTYNYSQSETNDIYEWDVVEKTGMNWQYYQNDPYDGRTTKFPGDMVKSNDKGELKSLPKISKNSLQFDMQSVWKSNSLITGTVTVYGSNYWRTDYIITEYESGTKWHGTWWYSYNSSNYPFYLDFSKVS